MPSNVTPKPQGTNKRQLRRTRSYAQLPLTLESPGFNNSGSEAAGNGMHDGEQKPIITRQKRRLHQRRRQKGFSRCYPNASG
jgi:hypothetical protein